MNSYILKKPSIPIGTQIAQFPPVLRALHCDERCEIYMIERTEDWQMIVVLFPLPTSVDEFCSGAALTGIYNGQEVSIEYADTLAIKQVNYSRFVLRITGAWARDCVEQLAGLNDKEVRNMIVEFASEIVEWREKKICPNLGISLVWLTRQNSTPNITTVLFQAWTEEREATAVKDFVSLLYFLVGGIDSQIVLERQIDLSKRSKLISIETSNILAKFSGLSKHAGVQLEFSSLKDSLQGVSSKALLAEKRLLGLKKVAGMHKLKALLLEEVVSPLRDPEKYLRYGLTVPNGILLFGPPGCGKTYISKQLAEELGYYFIEIIPSEVAGSFIHQTVLNIRSLFDKAVEMAPSVIFIDEFEALVPSRSELGGHQQYKSEEVNEMLVQLSSCAERNILLIAATNEPNKIDSAVRRTGRLDKLVYVGPPDLDARIEMLTLHVAGRPVEGDLDFNYLATKLEGYSASDLKFLVDEAARFAMQADSAISMERFSQALERVPPSILAAEEAKYQTFAERGVG